jgi:hypothetical protein
MASTTSLALRRHLSVFRSTLPPFSPDLVDSILAQMAPCLSFPTLQHFREDSPFFSFVTKRLIPVAWLSKVSPVGFGYPFDDVSSSALGIVFQFQRSWVSPFRAFLLLNDRKVLSNLSFRSCAFLHNLSALYRHFSGLVSSRKPYPFYAP